MSEVDNLGKVDQILNRIRTGKIVVKGDDKASVDDMGNLTEDPLFYRVEEVITDPIVVIKPVSERDGDELEYHVVNDTFCLLEVRSMPLGSIVQVPS